MPSMVFHPVEAPADRSFGRWVLDGFITLAAIALSLPPILGREDGHAHPWAFVLVLLTTLPLIVRRCWPVPVFATIVTAALVAGLFDHNAVAGPAVIVALYTVAAMSERRDAVVAAAVVVLITVTLTLVFAGRDWWFDSIFLTGLIAAALALGLYAATRRAYLAELHDRAERAERERDQQGELAASAERARIAREMHDIVAHHLTVMVALSEGAVAAAPVALASRVGATSLTNSMIVSTTGSEEHGCPSWRFIPSAHSHVEILSPSRGHSASTEAAGGPSSESRTLSGRPPRSSPEISRTS